MSRIDCLASLAMAGAVFFCAFGAEAQEAAASLEPGHVYADAAGSAQYMHLPQLRTGFQHTPSGQSIDDNSLWLGGGELGVGFVLPEGSDFLGSNTRIELRGNFAAGESDSGPVGNVVTIVSTSGFSAYTCPSCSVSSSRDVAQFGGRLLLRTDFALSPSVNLSLSAGPSYSGLYQDEEAKISGTSIVTGRKLSLDADYYGAGLGVDVAVKVGGGFSLLAGADIDLSYASASLHYKGGPSNFTMVDAGFTSFNDSAFSAHPELRLGAAYDAGFATFGIEGVFDYFSYVPVADAPTTSTETAGIQSGQAWSAGGELTTTIPF
jgi:hypothetical protein